MCLNSFDQPATPPLRAADRGAEADLAAAAAADRERRRRLRARTADGNAAGLAALADLPAATKTLLGQ